VRRGAWCRAAMGLGRVKTPSPGKSVRSQDQVRFVCLLPLSIRRVIRKTVAVRPLVHTHFTKVLSPSPDNLNLWELRN